jgi:hypothetical protein
MLRVCNDEVIQFNPAASFTKGKGAKSCLNAAHNRKMMFSTLKNVSDARSDCQQPNRGISSLPTAGLPIRLNNA